MVFIPFVWFLWLMGSLFTCFKLEKRATKAESQIRDMEDEMKKEIRQLQDQLKAAKHELDFAKTVSVHGNGILFICALSQS